MSCTCCCLVTWVSCFLAAVCPVLAAVWLPGLNHGLLIYDQAVWFLTQGQEEWSFLVERTNDTIFQNLIGKAGTVVKAAFAIDTYLFTVVGK